jgi:membrane protein
MKKVIGRIYHFIVDFTSEMNRDQVAVFSAQAAFFLLLSLFPFVMTILTFVKYLPITRRRWSAL